MALPVETKKWLLDAPEPYIRYQAQLLLRPDDADPSLLDTDPFIQENLRIISAWRSEVLARHDKPDLFFHRLSMLADLGVTRETRGAAPVIDSLLKNFTDDGSFLVNIMIPKAFGGTGAVHADWIICDFPVTLYALLRMTGAPRRGPDADSRLAAAVKKLEGLAGEEYYPCCGSIPKFKGPGPRNGMCPYANLLVARALGADPPAREGAPARKAVGAVLDHWENRKAKKPFLFGMGTDFLKLKFPMIWYNLLHVMSVLSAYPHTAADPRYREMLEHLRSALDGEGRATPQSIYMAYKPQEWSDKKKPSRLLTCLVHRIIAASAPLIFIEGGGDSPA